METFWTVYLQIDFSQQPQANIEEIIPVQMCLSSYQLDFRLVRTVFRVEGMAYQSYVWGKCQGW